MKQFPDVSVVIPARNESSTIGTVVSGLRQQLPGAELVVVDDGSTDLTGDMAKGAGAVVVRHRTSRGNGAAIKTGARMAKRDHLVLMDADGQHDPADVARLLAGLGDDCDLVIGSRSFSGQASMLRQVGNWIYNRLAGWVVGHPIADLTSGFRAVKTDKFRDILHLLPNGFSSPTTSTMAFFRCGYGVAFMPVNVGQRKNNKSHVRILRDGGRFLLIIFRIGTLYSPLKIFFPASLFFVLLGIAYCSYTVVTLHRFTNFGALLFITAILVFLIGLVSEQITQLLFSRRNRTDVQ